MRSVRWRKLRGDLRAAWGRVAAMQLAFALALAGVGVVLGARAVLGREIRASFASTQPADATLDLPGGVDAALLARVRGLAGIEDADARQVVRARVRTADDAPWQMFVLFVAEDFGALRLSTFQPETGAWPPPRGSILLERTAPEVVGVAPGAALTLAMPDGELRTVAIAGTVHDAGQAPSWQEHRGCGYATLETLAELGAPRVLRELLVRFRSVDDIEGQATRLAAWLREHGHAVDEVRVPGVGGAREHPHQALMDAVQLVLLGFSLVILVLCAVVFASMLSAMLARQVREIGVMKAIGATAGQLAGMYAVFVAALGVVAVAIAVPLARAGAGAMIDRTARMMNLAVADPAIPAWVYVALAALGTAIPLAFAAVPIARAMRISVRRALGSHGAAADHVRPSRLPLAARNALRRPLRLGFTMLLLVIGGAIVIAAASLERSLARVSSRLAVARHFDLELRLREPIAAERAAALAQVPGVDAVEAWSVVPAGLGEITHTFPDGGHGGLQLVTPPAEGSRMVTMPVLAGRWLEAGDTDAVVLGATAARGVRIGARIALRAAGRTSSWVVVGIVEEVGGRSAFVTDAAFRRATGRTGVNLLRFTTRGVHGHAHAHASPVHARRHDPAPPGALAGLERALAGASIEYAMPADLMRSIIDDHVALVTRAILAIAALLALVGLIALGSATAINVAERTRELGIMKTIGAGRGRIFRVIAGEALLIGLASAAIAALASVPLTALAIARIEARGFIAAPPFTLSWVALVAWPLAMAAGSVLAAALPAARAMRLSVREALAAV